MILVSTGGERHQPIDQTLKLYYESGIRSVELSGGPYFNSGLKGLADAIKEFPDLRVSVHNYFPVPQEPFVFNLGSLNEKVFQTSLNHAYEAIRWAHALGSPFYSFHAGFLLDPQVTELGKKIPKRTLFDREQSLNHFINAVKKISAFAKQNNVRLFIENNVLSKRNFQEFNENPLLCVTPEETLYCIQELKNDARLLIDVAHLKVSANSLEFDPVQFLQICEPYIDAYHLSDNDGTADTNQTFDKNAWFFKHLKKKVSFTTIEVYGQQPNTLFQLANEVSVKFISDKQ